MTPTEQFIQTLGGLKLGDLGRLRQCAGLPLHNSVAGFDLFSGLWWPLRQRSQRAPRREVAWLVAKLHAFRAIPQSAENNLPAILGAFARAEDRAAAGRRRSFDRLLTTPLSQIEPALQRALAIVGQAVDNGRTAGLDWARLTDDLSVWEREATRLKWAKQYLGLEP